MQFVLYKQFNQQILYQYLKNIFRSTGINNLYCRNFVTNDARKVATVKFEPKQTFKYGGSSPLHPDLFYGLGHEPKMILKITNIL